MGSALPMLGLPSKADIYAAALEGLVQVNGLILDKDPRIPPLYAAGVRWKAIPHDNWRRADQIAGEGWGDCEGLSAWRAAELRRAGEDPIARVGCYHTGAKKYHAIVIRGDDTIEDPSVWLGMRMRPNMPRDRFEMNVINGMWPAKIPGPRPVPASITIGWADDEGDDIRTDFLPLDDGQTQAQIKIPFADGTALVAKTTSAIDKATATARAANLLADTAGVLAKNPLLLAKMNPYTAAAVMLYSSPAVRSSLGALANQVSPLASKAQSAASGAVNFFRKLF
jgi:hypothetical protein